MFALFALTGRNEAHAQPISVARRAHQDAANPVLFLLSRLALYVYEYLLHVGAQKSAQTFLSEVRRRPHADMSRSYAGRRAPVESGYKMCSRGDVIADM